MALAAGHVTVLNVGSHQIAMALAPGHHVTASTNNDGSTSHQLRHFSVSKSSSPQDLRGGVLKKAPASYHTLRVRAGRSKKSTPTNHVEHHCEEGSNTDSSSTLKPPSLPPKLGLHWLDNGAELTGLKMEELVRGGHGMLLGSRIPKHYFMVKGFGESDQGDGSDPWETGSYDLALEHAGIQDLNIIKYTSVIPPEAEAVSVEEAKPFLRHGAVLESIMSVMHGVKGDRITAGVGRVQIRRKKDKFHIGGYAAEYEGHASADKAKSILKKDLVGIFQRRFDDKEYECFEEDFIIQESEVDKSFGSVLASICFVTYVLPTYTCA